MTAEHSPVIVVGYDGSTASRAAARYAAGEAGDTGRVVLTHVCPPPMGELGLPYYEDTVARLREHAEADMATFAGAELDGTQWGTQVVIGSPGSGVAYVAQELGAQEIVVGTRGRGRMASALGSVAQQTLHHASCPVVVVPEETRAHARA